MPSTSAQIAHGLAGSLEVLSRRVSDWVGSSSAFGIAAGIIVVWALSGPLFHFSDTWQLVINTGTTIVTFLMVFLIQRAQNRESRAVQLKLDELVAALAGASNRLIDVEDLSEEEIQALRSRYADLARRAARAGTKQREARSVDDEPERAEAAKPRLSKGRRR